MDALGAKARVPNTLVEVVKNSLDSEENEWVNKDWSEHHKMSFIAVPPKDNSLFGHFTQGDDSLD